jgi:hypothetical protein
MSMSTEALKKEMNQEKAESIRRKYQNTISYVEHEYHTEMDG